MRWITIVEIPLEEKLEGRGFADVEILDMPAPTYWTGIQGWNARLEVLKQLYQEALEVTSLKVSRKKRPRSWLIEIKNCRASGTSKVRVNCSISQRQAASESRQTSKKYALEFGGMIVESIEIRALPTDSCAWQSWFHEVNHHAPLILILLQ